VITVIGLGFVGLTTALGFSEKGYKVYGYDINKEKTKSIKDGKIPFYEENLEEVLNRNLNKNFLVSNNLEEAVQNSKYIFYCVGTPSDEDGNADLTYILNAVQDTLKVIKKGDLKIFIVKSTVPPSTTSTKIVPFIERYGFEVGKNIGLANNPEFLREGCAWLDFINPDRIVIGQFDEKTGREVEKIYKVFNCPIFRVSLNTAEYIKYLSNTLLASMISFSNELSMIAYEIGDIDIKNAFEILHLDRRWFGSPANMSTYVFPGCGFGGYCLPKDTKALYSLAEKLGFKAEFLKSVIDVNEIIKKYIVDKVISEIKEDEYIGILGLSFKSNSDDIRESPAKEIIEEMIKKGHDKIIVYDPIANENFKIAFKLPIEYAENIDDMVNKADKFVILTKWDEFKNNNKFKNKKIFDFRYIL